MKSMGKEGDHANYNEVVQDNININEAETIPYEITNFGYKCSVCNVSYKDQPAFKTHFDRCVTNIGSSLLNK